MQAELDVYNKLHQAPCTAAIAARAYFVGDLIIEGQSHPYMVMQRLGQSLESVTCAGLATRAFVQASCCLLLLSLGDLLRIECAACPGIAWVESLSRVHNACISLYFPRMADAFCLPGL